MAAYSVEQTAEKLVAVMVGLMAVQWAGLSVDEKVVMKVGLKVVRKAVKMVAQRAHLTAERMAACWVALMVDW